MDITSTAWQSEGATVFRLHQDGWDYGKPRMVNEVTMHLQPVRDDSLDTGALAAHIADLLNRFPLE